MNPDKPMPKTTDKNPNLPSARPAGSGDWGDRIIRGLIFVTAMLFLWSFDWRIAIAANALAVWWDLRPNEKLSHGHPTTQKDTI